MNLKTTRALTCWTMQVILPALIGFAMVAGVPGCWTTQKKDDALKQEQAREASQASDVYVHTVRWPGESFAVIAKWYSGDSKNWKIIADANPDINPRTIKLGDKIQIPGNILKTRDPMPKSCVVPPTRPASHRGQTGEPDPKMRGLEEEQLELYGPRE
jgi:hypothetical protein